MTTRATTSNSLNLQANGETGFLSPRVLMREAAKVVADLNVEIRPARIRRLVQHFLEAGRSDIDFRTWFIAYADPTGEHAVSNVVRERGY